PVADGRIDGAFEAGVQLLQPPDDGLDLLLGRQRGYRLLPRLGLRRRFGLLADAHDLPAVASNGDQLLAQELTILSGLDLVLPGLQPDLLGPRAGDYDIAAIHGHAHGRVIYLHDQCALRREQPDHGAAHVGEAGRFAQAEPGDQQDEDRGGSPGSWSTFPT